LTGYFIDENVLKGQLILAQGNALGINERDRYRPAGQFNPVFYCPYLQGAEILVVD